MTLQEYITDLPFLLPLILLLPIIILDWWAVRDISKYTHKERNLKIMWTNIVVLLPIIGVFFYLYHGRKRLQE